MSTKIVTAIVQVGDLGFVRSLFGGRFELTTEPDMAQQYCSTKKASKIAMRARGCFQCTTHVHVLSIPRGTS